MKCTSELLGRIAFTAAHTTVNLEYVFSFPLTPVPLTLCRGDGTMAQTTKRQLFAVLENMVEHHGAPTFVGTHIVDGNYQFHCMSPNQPVTYGGISEKDPYFNIII